MIMAIEDHLYIVLGMSWHKGVHYDHNKSDREQVKPLAKFLIYRLFRLPKVYLCIKSLTT